MDIIHGVKKRVLPRHAQRALADRLRVMPAVVVTGARQTGKITLAQALTPMVGREQRGLGRCGLWEELLGAKDSEWLDLLRADRTGHEDWIELARRGGFPTPAVHLSTVAERAVWFEGYVRTYLERDLQTLSSISALPDFRRLMRADCLRLGQLVNQTELARDVSLPQPTVHRYLNLLETS